MSVCMNRNKNHTQNAVEKLAPDTLVKSQNLVYLWINSMKSYKVCFYCMSKSSSTKIC